MAERIDVARDGDDLKPAPAAPRLNAPDFAAVLQDTVVPAPAAEGPDFLSRFYPHVGLDSLLKRHEKTPPKYFACTKRGNENLPKGYENNRKLSSKIFIEMTGFFISK
jgi:hypothetical protein